VLGVVADGGIGLQRCGRHHQEPRGAEAALEGVLGGKGTLERGGLTAGPGEPFHGAYRPAVTLHSEDEARPDRIAVHQDRARSADTVLAAQVRAGEPAVLPEHVGEDAAGLDVERILLAVDGEADFHSWSPFKAAARDR